MPPVITVATSPKPFTDPLIRLIQTNALRNWKHLGLEVLVFGDEEGVAEVVRALDLIHIPQVARNAQGTPLLSDILHQARARSQGRWLMMANADVLFTPCLFRAVDILEKHQANPCIVTGRRWDVDVKEALDFEPGWNQVLWRRIREQGRLNLQGMDYFLFPRDLPLEMPPLAIGRAGWDNWMIYHGRRMGWKVVDATPAILVIHQNHHYRHLPGGKPHYKLEETKENIRLAGGEDKMYTLWEATHILKANGIEPAPWHPMKPLRRLELRLLRHGFPERGWKRILIRWVRRKWQAALVRNPNWWKRYYRIQQPCV